MVNTTGPPCVLTSGNTLLSASCAQTKGNAQTAPILEYPLPDGPFEVVGIDLLQLQRSSQNSVYILVCVDHFTRFVVLAPLPNKSGVTVAHAIVSHLICHYTIPRVLLSDNGKEFKNQVLVDICTQDTLSRHSSLHKILLLMAL